MRDRAAAATRPPSPRARRHPGPRHVRGHDHARPQPSRLDGHRLPAQRLRAPGALLRDLEFAGLDGPPLRAVFIRAPWIESHGDDVQVLAELQGRPIAARQGSLLAVAFHPELGRDTRLHEAFLAEVRAATGALIEIARS